MRTSNIQFTGMASGLDTASIVKAMLSTHQGKIDRENEKKLLLDWKKEVWNDVNKKINTFQKDWVDKLRLESTFDVFKATSSSNAISVSTSGDVSEGIHEIEVTQVAEGAFVGKDITLQAGQDPSGKLKDLIGLQGTEKLRVNGEEIEVTEDDTLDTLAKKIEEKDPNLNVNFDPKNGKLFISTKNTGENAKIKIELDNPNGALGKLGLHGIDEKGQEAVYKYNGIELKSESNNLHVNGLNITINDETQGKTIKIQVSKDTDKVVETLSGFVEAYNTLITDLNSMLGAKSSKLKPLTDEEKEKMTESEIAEHEKAIKDSLLARDPSLAKVLNTMRADLQSKVEGNAFGVLADIGITTGNYADKGKLVLDKNKLTKALNDNPGAIKELFTAKGEGKAQGIGTLLDKSFKELEKNVKDMKSYDSFYNDKILQDKIRTSNERISELQDRYARMEAIYYKKFTAMEKSLSMLNSQGASISSMFMQ